MSTAQQPRGVVAVVPAKDEEERVGRTITALQQIPAVAAVVVVDDGSQDRTAAVAEWTGGVEVVRHERNRGKAAALTSGAERAAELAPGAPLLFVDADLQETAADLGVIIEPVLRGEADMTIAVLPPQQRRGGGFGVVVRTAREGVSRLTGWTPTQPLSGQRCLTREALEAGTPLAHGWGVEVGLTIDVLRAGLRVLEVPCQLEHRVTGRDLSSQLHRAGQLVDVARAVADRSGAKEKVCEAGLAAWARARSGGARLATAARDQGVPAVRRAAGAARERGGPVVDRARNRIRNRTR